MPEVILGGELFSKCQNLHENIVDCS